MAKLSQMRGSVTQSVLIYGPPKVGKTELAGELARHPEIAGIIWVDIEKGVETLMKLPAEAQEKISVISLPDTRSNPVGIETALKLIRGTAVAICDEHGVVNCAICRKEKIELPSYELNALPSNWVVVFDSLTQLTDSAISYITRGKADDYKMQFDDWGDLGKLMAVFLSHVQQAKFNVICISHEVEAENEDGTIRVVPVAGSRAFSRNTAKYFGHCVYARVAGKKHTFVSSTTGMANVVAGSRADVRLEDIKDGRPSLYPIFAAAAVAAKHIVLDQPETKPAIAKEDNKKVSSSGVGTVEPSVEDKTAPSTEQVEEVAAEEVIDHVAAMSGLKLMDRIAYKKKHGIS